MNIVIFGASGGTGRCLVAQAVTAGHHVTVLQHHAKIHKSNSNIRILEGDVLNYFDVENAVRGQDAVLCTLGTKNIKGTSVLSRGTHNICAAMKRFALSRLICESSLGVGDSLPQTGFFFRNLILPLFIRHAYADKVLQEQEIKDSGLKKWVIIRPARLTNGKQTGQYHIGFSEDKNFSGKAIARADVAAFMLQQLKEDTYIQKVIGLSA
ncbi:NAD(P)-dependent oxidoreductase [Beggiatoa leptomitoformis]|uniref:NAD(P)H-binding protein n=1 Tax=Beggiatoa leptomitoformis TaxID=288004 RepID=A0A2N9YFY0_9GAMM|nr:SDR family oxidoreductase [Beggiatoa leptomitoformis]ALG68289.1 NAD(P)H-binding protein [Beggiatoa leptomitoformis]AUI69400.1 NAD(P)H-binding protein [Beggiatoa leptomitoformis]